MTDQHRPSYCPDCGADVRSFEPHTRFCETRIKGESATQPPSRPAKKKQLKFKRDVAIPLAMMHEISKDLERHHATMRVNAIRARLGIVEACIHDVLDAYEGSGDIDEYE